MNMYDFTQFCIHPGLGIFNSKNMLSLFLYLTFFGTWKERYKEIEDENASKIQKVEHCAHSAAVSRFFLGSLKG